MPRFRKYFAALVLFAAASAPADSQPVTIRTKADMRLWQTVFDRTCEFSWPWEEGAEFARLDFTNLLTREVASFEIPRAPGELNGSCPQLLQIAGDALFDATLVQLAGEGEQEREISRETATLAYVANAGGGPIDVRVENSREWRIVRQPCVVGFDPAWRGIPGESGYRIQRPMIPGFTIRIR